MKGKERINDKTFQILELEVSMLLKWQLSLNCSIGGILSKSSSLLQKVTKSKFKQ